MADFTHHQKKIIRRYYDNREAIGYQRLAELASELYLAEGDKKLDRLWDQVASALAKVDVAAARRDHILARRDPQLVAELVKELTGR